MLKSLRVSLIAFFCLMTASVFTSHGQALKPPASGEQHNVYRNQYGSVVRDASGAQINYSRAEMQAQALAATTPVNTSANAASLAPPLGAQPVWAYAVFGDGIGYSNIVVAPNGSSMEEYMGGSGGFYGGNAYWFALRYNATTHEYEQVFVSPFFEQGVRRIAVADVVGTSANEIIVALVDGQILLYDQASKKLLQTLSTLANGLYGMAVTDIDGDGIKEFVLSTYDHLYVYANTGALKWSVAGVGGYDLVAGQMDADAAMEIALADGHVIDCATHAAQWTKPNGFGYHLRAADIDGDGKQELIVAEQWQSVRAYDVDQQQLKWSIPTPLDIGAIYVTDINGDSIQDLIVGDGQWGNITAFNTVTQQMEWFIHNPEHGVTNIAVGDVDGDGVKEVLWGAGATSTGPDHLYVANWQNGQIKWQNLDLVGPFIGPEIGDLDGDGRPEMVVVSKWSDATYGSGRILVFDAQTRRLRGVSQELVEGSGWTGIHDLKLRDVDGDGRQEILIAAGDTYDGLIEIYDFAANNTFTLQWQNATRPFGATFYSVEAADIDNDGQLEIIGGVGQEHSGATGVYFYAYSYATRQEKWRSPHTAWGHISDVAVADLNQDGIKEIVGLNRTGGVYIFNGVSKQLAGIINGEFTAMRVYNLNNIPTIVLGNAAGDLIMYRASGNSYVLTYQQKLVAGPIDGFTIDSASRVWIGSGGALNLLTLSGTNLGGFSGYGPLFGMRTAFVPASTTFFSSGSYSVNAFAFAPPFDVCVQDDSTGDLLQFNSTTGEYQFSHCRTNIVLGGTGTLTRRGTTMTLQHYASDRRVLVQVDTNAKKATASVQVFSIGATFTISDHNITNNTCTCP